MELPPVNAKFDHKMRYGAYVMARLRLRKLEQLAEKVERKSNRLRDVNHRLDDASARVHAAMAMRDHWVEGLAKKAQDLQGRLDGSPPLRAANMRIFKKRIDHFIDAPLVEVESRYGELIELVEKHLTADAELQRKTVKALKVRLKGFKEATRLMSEARGGLFEARNKREKSTKAWDKTMREVFEELKEQIGEADAENAFPQVVRAAHLDDEERASKLGDLRGHIDQARLQSIRRSKS